MGNDHLIDDCEDYTNKRKIFRSSSIALNRRLYSFFSQAKKSSRVKMSSTSIPIINKNAKLRLQLRAVNVQSQLETLSNATGMRSETSAFLSMPRRREIFIIMIIYVRSVRLAVMRIDCLHLAEWTLYVVREVRGPLVTVCIALSSEDKVRRITSASIEKYERIHYTNEHQPLLVHLVRAEL